MRVRKNLRKAIYEPPVLDKANMTQEEIRVAEEKEKLHKLREKRIKKAFRISRLRCLKNLFLWLTGVVSCIILLVGSIIVGIKVVPISTYVKLTGQDTSSIVSDKISSKSILDALLDFDEYALKDIPAIETLVNNVLKETGIDDFVIIDYEGIRNIKFLNSANGTSLIDELTKCLKLNPEMENLQEIKAFSQYQETDCPLEKRGNVWAAKQGINKNLYSYRTGETYSDVFTNEQVASTLKYMSNAQMANVVFYYKPLTHLPFFDIANDITSVFDRVEIVDVLSIVNKNVEIDPLLFKVFEGKSIASLISDMNFDELLDKIMISDLGNVDELFGQLSDLSVFNEWELVKADKIPELDSQLKITYKQGTEEFTSNPMQYYYLSAGTHGQADAEYLPAFDENGVRVPAVNDSTPLYYPNLTEISFRKVLDIIGDSIGRLKISELLETFNVEIKDDSIINNILGDKAINELGEIKPENIKLVDVLLYDGNEALYELLLSSLNLLPVQEAGEDDAAFNLRVKAAAEQVTAKQLGDIKPENLNLTIVMPQEKNKKLYDILLQALTITDSNDMVIDNPTVADIKVGHLSSFNQNNIDLTSILAESNDNKTLFKALRSALGLGEQDPIKIGYLQDLEIDNVSLSVVLDVPTAENFYENKDLYDILLQALTITDSNNVVINNPTPNDVKIRHLTSYDVNKLYLKTIIGDNANNKLKTALSQACGIDYENILISDLRNDSFDIGNIRLTSIMTKDGNGSYGNNILDAVLATETEENVITLNNVASHIGNLSLYETYGINCFTKKKSESIDKNQTDQSKIRKFIFDEDENAFIHVSEQDILNNNIPQSAIYYIHENDGIWLLICFESVGYEDALGEDTDGRPEKYVISQNTLNDLTGTSIFKNLFKDITIRQFVDAGIIDDGDGYQEYIYKLNLHDVLDALDNSQS